MTRRALVTGGAGFIGGHLAHALLADGWSVDVVDDLSTGSAGNVPAAAELIEADLGARGDGAPAAGALHGDLPPGRPILGGEVL